MNVRPWISRIASLDRPMLIFMAARIGGLGLKPLIIFVAASTGRDLFAQRYALLVSALASLFVLTGGLTHIDYYKRRFGGGSLAVRRVYERHFGDSMIQFLVVLPLIAVLAWAWASDLLLVALIVLLVGIEKFFDEDQRHFLFTKQYGRWSVNFGARVILPSLIILAAIWVALEPLILIYATASVGSFILYLLIRPRHSRLYGVLLARQVKAFTSNGRAVFATFWTRWRSEYAFNQIWTFTSVNIYLVDRFWVANQSALRLDAYVFFDSILKVAVVAHSLFYFIPRRPRLIKPDAGPAAELLRWPNLVSPALFSAAALGVAYTLKEMTPAYEWVPGILLLGMAVFFFLQAVSLVMVETVFWQRSRRKLVAVDVLAIAWIFLIFLATDPELWAIPWIASTGVMVRISFYLLLARPPVAPGESSSTSY